MRRLPARSRTPAARALRELLGELERVQVHRLVEPINAAFDELLDTYLRYLVNGIRKELASARCRCALAARASQNPYEKSRLTALLTVMFGRFVNATVYSRGRKADASGEGDMVDEARRRDRRWAKFQQMRTELGASFVRILSYFREDGEKAVEKIEQAMHRRDAAALVLPAHTLKAEARQFGAEPVAALAEEIEEAGRRGAQRALFPDDILPQVAQLRPLYLRTHRPARGRDQSARPAPPRRRAARATRSSAGCKSPCFHLPSAGGRA